MTLSIKDPEAGRLAHELAAAMHTSLTKAIIVALRERLEWEKKQHLNSFSLQIEKGMEIARRCAALPVLDNRHPDEILGYDERGMIS